MARQRAVEDIGGLTLAVQRLRQLAELVSARVREQALALVAIDAVEGLGGEFV